MLRRVFIFLVRCILNTIGLVIVLIAYAVMMYCSFMLLLVIAKSIIFLIMFALKTVLLTFIVGDLLIILYDFLRLVSYACLSMFIAIKVAIFSLLHVCESVIKLITTKQILFPLFLAIIYVVCCLEAFVRAFILPSSQHFKDSINKYLGFSRYFVLDRSILSLEDFPFGYFTNFVNKFFRLKTIDCLLALNKDAHMNTWFNSYFMKDKNAPQRQIYAIQIIFEIIDGIVLAPIRFFLSFLYQSFETELKKETELAYIAPIFMLFLYWPLILFGLTHADQLCFFNRGILGTTLDFIHFMIQTSLILISDLVFMLPFIAYATDTLVFNSKTGSEDKPIHENFYMSDGSSINKIREQSLNSFGASLFANNTEPLADGAFYRITKGI